MRKMFKHPAVPKKVRQELNERAVAREVVKKISINEDEFKKAFKSPRKFRRFLKKLTKQAKKLVDEKRSSLWRF